MATAKEYQDELENLAKYARGLEEGLQRFAGAMAIGVRQEDILRSALQRTLGNFKFILAGKPVKDVEETIAEAEHALDPGKFIREEIKSTSRPLDLPTLGEFESRVLTLLHP